MAEGIGFQQILEWALALSLIILACLVLFSQRLILKISFVGIFGLAMSLLFFLKGSIFLGFALIFGSLSLVAVQFFYFSIHGDELRTKTSTDANPKVWKKLLALLLSVVFFFCLSRGLDIQWGGAANHVIVKVAAEGEEATKPYGVVYFFVFVFFLVSSICIGILSRGKR